MLVANCIPHAKCEKNPLKYQFLCFFTTLVLIWPTFCPKDYTHFTFFDWFPMKYVRRLKLMLTTCVSIQQFWKKSVKPLKFAFFGPKMEFFFDRNNKSRSSAFRNFLFYQNVICFDWVMNLFLSWVMFSVKKVSFPAKTALIKKVVSIFATIHIDINGFTILWKIHTSGKFLTFH